MTTSSYTSFDFSEFAEHFGSDRSLVVILNSKNRAFHSTGIGYAHIYHLGHNEDPSLTFCFKDSITNPNYYINSRFKMADAELCKDSEIVILENGTFSTNCLNITKIENL